MEPGVSRFRGGEEIEHPSLHSVVMAALDAARGNLIRWQFAPIRRGGRRPNQAESNAGGITCAFRSMG